MTYDAAVVDEFWSALGDQQSYYTKPDQVYDDPIFRIKTRGRFMFDDGFWSVFHAFPFHICHIQYLNAAQTGGLCDEQVFDMRFKVLDAVPSLLRLHR